LAEDWAKAWQLDEVGRLCHIIINRAAPDVMSIVPSIGTAFCTPRAGKYMISRHEPCQHQWHKLSGLDRLSVFLRKDLGVGDEIAMHGRGQFNGDLDWPIIGKGGQFQLGHRIPQF
jgi:hypothetical protein